eukprot:3142144-Amphidinium_carterae.2
MVSCCVRVQASHQFGKVILIYLELKSTICNAALILDICLLHDQSDVTPRLPPRAFSVQAFLMSLASS